MTTTLLVDVGSTFTKAVLVGADGDPVGTAQAPTTLGHDVMDGVRAVARQVGADAGMPVLACSSAGGGLRLAVVGYERQVTTEAGHRVGLSSGAKVVHVAAGRLDRAAVRALEQSAPDLVLLVGGTDGGNAEVLRHNGSRLAEAELGRPVIVAGNVAARDEVVTTLWDHGQPVTAADNVLPRIGVVEPESARAAIRSAFLRHVIGGTALSTSSEFRDMVRAPTPDAVLTGVEVVADVVDGDVLVVDVGGATTDVYSVVRSHGPANDVAGSLPATRTVEGDLGVRWNAVGVVEAAARERIPVAAGLPGYAALVAADPAHLPADREEAAHDLQLATVAALVAVRRHARPPGPGQDGRGLGDVRLVLGSGGVLRHANTGSAAGVLRAVTSDHAGGWKVPRAARTGLDVAYLLFAVGLLAPEHPATARALAAQVLSQMVGGAG